MITQSMLTERYFLEKQLLTLDAQVEQLQQQLPQCKYRLRQSQEALWSYESFGLKSMLDKLSGKWEEKQGILLRENRAAEAGLHRRQQELEAAKARREDVFSRLERLRDYGDVLEIAASLEEAQREMAIQLEARLCAEKLIPALEENGSTLALAQQWARPHNQPEAVPGQTLGILLSQSDALAKEAMALMERIAQCGIFLDIHPYFTNPTGYIGGVTRFQQLDRINNALDAIAQTQKQACRLLEQLPEPEEETL